MARYMGPGKVGARNTTQHSPRINVPAFPWDITDNCLVVLGPGPDIAAINGFTIF